MTKWFWQLKWALVIAIFAGPAFAYWSYQTANRIERVMTGGAEYTALVTGGVIERGRRGRRSYGLEVNWVDADGATHNDSVDISSAYAAQVFTDDFVMIETAELRYLPSEVDGPVVVAADGPQQIADQRMFVWYGIGAGILGLVLAPLWFWLERRMAKKQDDDIDAELARMRAGQAQT
ncbi:MAG: hypothetical protein H7124_16995 [Phycisphaerales bacterium]|nr:hypothetical protein [Hyphomonadaceae bacterium]